MTADLFLVHGGLWDTMDAERFWRTPGIVAGLESSGLEVLAPDRPRMPSGWTQEVEELRVENPSHQRKTVDALLELIPGSRELPGTTDTALPATS
jgi:hypothetical protein